MKKYLSILIALVVVIALGVAVSAETTMPFEDVSQGAYYYDAVSWAVENGITKGTSDTAFSPDSPCTRGQIITFLYRYWQKYGQVPSGPVATAADAPLPTDPTNPTEPVVETDPIDDTTPTNHSGYWKLEASNAAYNSDYYVKLQNLGDGTVKIEAISVGKRFRAGDTIVIKSDLLNSSIQEGCTVAQLNEISQFLNTNHTVVQRTENTITVTGSLTFDSLKTIILIGDGTNNAYIEIKTVIG